MKEKLNPVLLEAELLRLEGKHGPALRALLEAVLRVVVGMGRSWENYLLIQSLAREMGCGSMLPVLADLELVGVVQRNKGDIHFPWDGSGQAHPDPAVVSAVEEFLSERARMEVPPEPQCPPELPADLFEDIVGHGEVKELLRAAVLAARPVHVLLVGPPALAKSLFLWELEEALGERCWWALGSAASKAGLLEVLLERRPWMLLVDELDKMDGRDMAALLSAMEGGRLSRTKVGKMSREALELRVAASANDTRRLPPELLSRFAIRRVEPYTPVQFREVVVGVLTKREKLPLELAEEVARALGGKTQDVRGAVRAARLAPQLGVERAVRLLLG